MSLRYDYLKKNIKLDENQIKTFNNLIFKTEGIQGYDLKKFFELINKSELTAEEQAKLNELKNKTKLSNEELNQLKELIQSSGFDLNQFEQYRNLSVKDVVTNGRLGEFPEADSGNTAMLEMGKSKIFKQAMQKYKDKPNAEELAMIDYLKDMFPEGLDKSEFQKRLNTLLGGCNDRTQIRVLKLLKDNGVFQRYKDYIPSEDEMYAGGYAVFDSEQINKIQDPKKRAFWRNASANYGVITKDYERTLDFNRTGGDIDLEYQRQIAAEYSDKEEYVEQVVNDFPKNSELYTLDAQKNIIQTGGTGLENLMNKEQINNYANDLGNYVAKSDSNELKAAYASSVDTYSGQACETASMRASELVYTPNNNALNSIELNRMNFSEIKKALDSLGYVERKALIKQLTIEQLDKLPITLCQDFPDLIEKFVNSGKGIEIINKCDIPSGDRAIALMMNDSKERKKLAAVRPERFSQYTQRMLEETGVIKKKNSVDPLRRQA